MDEEYDEAAEPVDTQSYIFSLYITDQLKQIFILVLLVGNFLSVNIAVIFMCLSWYVRSTLNKQIAFLQEFYSPGTIPAMLGISGFVMLCASVVGVKAAIGGRMLDEESDLKSSTWFFFIYARAAAATFGAVLLTAMICFIDIAVLGSALGDGLLAGMKKYIEDAEVKPELDRLQMEYKCCGSKNYKDWYKVWWVNNKYLQTGDTFVRKASKDGKYTGKDVPFSCCKWDVMRPCVDTRVEDGQYNSKYSFPDDLTLHKKGCREAVMGFLGHTLFSGVGLFVFFCSLLWGALAVMGRYLHTSQTHISAGEPPIGWLVPYVYPQPGANDEASAEESD